MSRFPNYEENNPYDICEECSEEDDDYGFDSDGELECRCPKCPCNLYLEYGEVD